MDIGAKLKQARTASALTQEQVAEALGVSRQTLSNWENEKTYPDIVNVIAMSELYGVPLDALLKGEAVSPRYRSYLQESTDKAVSRRHMGELMVVLAILLVWAAGLWSFWVPGSLFDEFGYGLIWFYLVNPLTVFSLSLVTGVRDFWGRWKWLLALVFGALCMLAPYLTFDMAWMLAQNHIKSPEAPFFICGAMVSLIGLGIGSGLSWIGSLVSSRRNSLRQPKNGELKI